jgi:hypothetical protein
MLDFAQEIKMKMNTIIVTAVGHSVNSASGRFSCSDGGERLPAARE